MASGQLSSFIRHLRRVIPLGEAGAVSDAQLLERFARLREEAAFEVLVWRHGPMVLNVCLRILRREHDAEDAFQATFLALVRKAGAIGKGESVGSWLYKVAYRVALRARTLTPMRPLADDPTAPAPNDEILCREMHSVLNEEIGHLPDKYRAAFVLCHVEGQTTDAAALALGCPRGTISTRLSRARKLLRRRLARRGYDLSAPAGFEPVVPVLPSALVQATVNAVRFGTVEQAIVAGAISVRVATLTKGAMGTMSITKFTLATAIIVAVSLLGGACLVHRAQGDPPAQIDTAPTSTSSAGAAKDTSVVFAWKFEKAKPFYQEWTTETSHDMVVQGNKANQTQSETFYFRWTPVKEQNDNWTLKQEYLGVKLDIDIGGNKTQFDSTKEEPGTPSPIADFYRALIGAQFRMTLDKDYRVSKIEGREEFARKLVIATPSLGQVVQGVLREDALRHVAETTFANLPDDPVRPGDTWTRKSKRDMGPAGVFVTTSGYTYAGKEGKLDKITMESTLESRPAADGGLGLPFNVKKGKLKGEGTGTLWFDRAKGRVVRLELTQKVRGKLTVAVGEQESELDMAETQRTLVKTTRPGVSTRNGTGIKLG
jgi:RNA polymerase sigma factor (sigma-70 family)